MQIVIDTTGRAISKETLDLTAGYNTDSWLRSVEYNYDLNNNVSHFAFADRNTSFVTAYEYGKDNLLSKTTLPSNKEIGYTYDNLGRLTGKNLNTTTPVENVYTYADSARGTVTEDGVTKKYTTTKLETETVAGTKYKYAYDVYGNITHIYSVSSNDADTLLYQYIYDTYNQLTDVYDYVNSEQCEYIYNSAGNITHRNRYSINSSGTPTATLDSNRYTYADTNGWGDLLTSYNGQALEYDAIGNPETYRDGITMTWQNGRELASFTQTNGASVNYTYDVDGLRTGKTVTQNGTATEYNYVYENGLLLQMTRGSRVYDFSYDANGTPVSIAYRSRATANPTYYYYGTNSSGDVVALYTSSGTVSALYDYDAYGKLLSVETAAGVPITSETSIAIVNPLRYRGYVYDTETGFYYLQSRYYDPTTCRFVNGDGYCATGQGITGNNMFAYCNNNPVAYSDPTGNCSIHTYYYMPSCPGCNPDVAAVHAERGADWAFKRLEKDYGFTHSMSIDVLGIGIGPFSFSVQAGFSTDIKGNLVLQCTLTGKIGVPGSDSWNFFGGVNNMISNVPDVSYLEGESYQLGGGVSALIPDTPISIYKTCDLNIMEYNTGYYYGYSRSKGVGFFSAPGIEGHLGMSNTFNFSVIENGKWWWQ